MRLTERYRARLSEYLYFVRLMRRPGGSGYIILNSKLAKFVTGKPSDAGSDPSGVSPWEAMMERESSGKTVRCRSNKMLSWLLAGKAARDWHVTEWANGIASGVIGGTEELAEWGVPPSLILSVREALIPAIRRAKRGG